MNIQSIMQVRDAAAVKMMDVKVHHTDRKRAMQGYDMAVKTLRKLLPNATLAEVDPVAAKYMEEMKGVDNGPEKGDNP